jgi:hypothetical protein
MAFALLVDVFQMRMTKTAAKKVQPHEHYLPDEAKQVKKNV